MTKVTYIVDCDSEEDYIERVINSLKELKGDFRKEYLFVNNHPTAKSTSLLQQHSKDLRNATILVGKKNSAFKYGPLSIAQGEYIKFVGGNEFLDKNSTVNLLDSLYKHGHRVAFGLQGSYKNNAYDKKPASYMRGTQPVITNPVLSILNQRGNLGRMICSSASLFEHDLIEEINEPENTIYSQDISLIIKCATKSNFVFCPETISYKLSEVETDNNPHLQQLELYNRVRAIRKLLDYDPISAEKYKKEIYSAIIYAAWKLNKKDYSAWAKYFSSKLYIPNYSLDELKALLDIMFEKNFLNSSNALEHKNLVHIYNHKRSANFLQIQT